jgi:NAD-dependent SIR2 family protein deacetylase
MLVVGTSLEVQPAASLVDERKKGARLFVVDPNADPSKPGSIAEPATVGVPRLVALLKGELES